MFIVVMLSFVCTDLPQRKTDLERRAKRRGNILTAHTQKDLKTQDLHLHTKVKKNREGMPPQ